MIYLSEMNPELPLSAHQSNEFKSSFPVDRLDEIEKAPGLVFLEQYGIGHLADTEIEVHGQKLLLSDAPQKCPPFANMVKEAAELFSDLPDGSERLEKLVLKSAAATQELPPSEIPQEVPKDQKKN